DGFTYETNADIPGVSLRAEAGTTLAEQIQAKFSANDALIASLTERVTALEIGTGGAGWIPIGEDNSPGQNFVIDLTAGGKFASPPGWTVVQVFLRVDLSQVDKVLCRVNSDSSNIYRSGSTMIDSDVPSNFDAENFHYVGNLWQVAQMSTISTGVIDFRLIHAHGDPGLCSFQATASRQSDDGTFHRHQLSSGSLTEARTVTSLQFIANSGSMFDACYWRAVGLRMEHPS